MFVGEEESTHRFGDYKVVDRSFRLIIDLSSSQTHHHHSYYVAFKFDAGHVSWAAQSPKSIPSARVGARVGTGGMVEKNIEKRGTADCGQERVCRHDGVGT